MGYHNYHGKQARGYKHRRVSDRRRAYLSDRAKRQNRNSDGTFAKGFKSTHVPNRRDHSSKNRPHSLLQFNNRIIRRNNNTIKPADTRTVKKMGIFDIFIKGKTHEFGTIERQISNNFTKKELDSVSNDGIYIEVKDLSKNEKKKLAGQYCFKKDSRGREHIVIDDAAVGDHETVTHEMVHLCRNMDPERKGLQKSLIRVNGGKRNIKNEDVSLEEALTVAETIARTNTDFSNKHAGYYRLLKNTKGKKIDWKTALIYKFKDAKLIKGKNRLHIIGRNAYQRVIDIFPKLKISRFEYKDVKAINRFKKLGGEDGDKI